jgi:hypothetical protein
MDSLFPLGPYEKLRQVYEQNRAALQGQRGPSMGANPAPGTPAPMAPQINLNALESMGLAPQVPSMPGGQTAVSGPQNAPMTAPSGLAGDVPIPREKPLFPQTASLGTPTNIVPEGYGAGAATAVQQAQEAGAGDILAGLQAPQAPAAQRISSPGLPRLQTGQGADQLVQMIMRQMGGGQQNAPELPQLNRMLR